MPLTTSVECPHCGFVASTTKVILPRAKVRCSRCRSVFQVLPSPVGLVETIPVADDLARARMREVLEPDAKPDPGSWERDSLSHLLAETEVAPPPGGPVPLAQKKLELDGKPLPFHHSRTFMVAVALAALALAGYGFVTWYVDQVQLLTTAASKAEAKRTAKVAKAAAPKVAPEAKRSVPTVMIGAPVGPVAFGKGGVVDEGRSVAPATSRVGDLVVGVSAARLGPSNRSSAANALTLSLRITNLSDRPVPYSGWSGFGVRVLLRDQFGNYYNKITAEGGQRWIQPGVTITDTLAFESPAVGAQLDLDLPDARVKDKVFRFRINGMFIERPPLGANVGLNLVNRARRVEQAPAAPTPYDPETDPQVRDDVLMEYRDGMRRIQRRILGMASNRAAEARRTEPINLIRRIAEKHKLEVNQVRRMVGDL